jgi:hypothetical protein
VRRHRLQNEDGDTAEVRLDGISIDGELNGDPVRVYAHLLPKKPPSTADEAEAAVARLLRDLRSSGWKLTRVEEDGRPFPLPSVASAPREN